jgi:hypothetical protein
MTAVDMRSVCRSLCVTRCQGSCTILGDFIALSLMHALPLFLLVSPHASPATLEDQQELTRGGTDDLQSLRGIEYG